MGSRIVGAAKGVAGIALKASGRWLLAIVLYAILGTLLSWICYAFLAPALWATLPAFPGSRAGGLGAILALVLVLVSPCGLISLVYLLAFPLGFAFLGHYVGTRSALDYLTRAAGEGLSGQAAGLVWPAVMALTRTPGRKTAHGFLSAVKATGDLPGASKRVLGWLLEQARIPQIVTTGNFLERATTEPDLARLQLEDALRETVRSVTEQRLMLPFWIGGIVVALITALKSVWLGWLGA